MMQIDEDFNIKFVTIVKKHKCLYDKKVPEYRNKDEQEKSWIEIAQEARESISHCKERWRNLRACLSRYIKQQNSVDPQHKPYYLTEHMQFLLPFLKSHRQLSNGGYSNYEFNSEMSLDIKTSDQDDTNDHVYNPLEQKYPMVLPNQSLSETDSTPSINCVPDVHVQIGAPETEPEVLFMTSTERIQREKKRIKLEYPHTAVTASQMYAENSDMDFFRSILPDIQEMNAQQKRKFKIGVLQLVDEVYVKYPEKRTALGPAVEANGWPRNP